MLKSKRYLADLGRNITRSARALAASPGFTMVALLSLSMGICVAACAFSEMNGIVLRNLPVVSKPHELVALELPVTYPEFKRYRERSDVFVSAAAYIAPVPFTLSFAGHKERVWGHLVSSSYFSTLGVAPSMERLFGAAEEELGITPEVVHLKILRAPLTALSSNSNVFNILREPIRKTRESIS